MEMQIIDVVEDRTNAIKTDAFQNNMENGTGREKENGSFVGIKCVENGKSNDPRLLNSHHEQLKKFADNDMAFEDVVNFYNVWHAEYHETSATNIYMGPKHLAEELGKHLSKDVSIIDIGSGSGLLGKEMNELGFKNIDGLEPAENFLESCMKTGHYRTLFNEGIHDNQESSIPAGSYDCVMTCGAYVKGHLPVSSVREFIRITKKGGIIGIMFRKRYSYDVPEYTTLLPTMKQLEEEKAWVQLEHKVTENFFDDDQGYLFIYKKL